jgi:hypothetical protein
MGMNMNDRPFTSLSALVSQAYPNCWGETIIFNDIEYTIYTKNGKFDRENGPALVCKDYQIWFRDGHFHCDTGPAFVYSGPMKHHDWYFNGIHVSDIVESWLDAYRLLPKDPQSWTGQHKVYFKLTFGGLVERD